jgi:hypothetical protein
MGNIRQAVVIVHGIGEQRPMETLRGFVRGVIGIDRAQKENLPFYSKPDRISDSLELRRLTVDKKCTGGTPTDFYELYWQHLMAGTTLAHIQAWLEILLLRQFKSVPQRLRLWWCLAWIMIILALFAVISLFGYFLYLGNPPGVKGIWAVILIFLVRPLLIPLLRYLVVKFGINYVGDAARYLSPFPENVGIRHNIRSAGLKLLRGLHLDPLRRYDRIIVVGHSLGSVIAYDILICLWQEMHSKVERTGTDGKPELIETDYLEENNFLCKVEQPGFDELFKVIERKTDKQAWKDQYRQCQDKLLEEYDDNYEKFAFRFPWRITDFVTLGSPLTHADFLLADNAYPFCEKLQQREFPTCPPQLEDSRDDSHTTGNRGLLKRVLKIDTQEKSILILHHAALFACTRWTNLYFPGDIIGGKISHLFGDGIQDVELSRGAKNWASHVEYWSKESALKELRTALRLKKSERNSNV